MNAETCALDAGFRRDRRQHLERPDEFRTAVRISRVVERVHANHEIVRIERFRPGQRQGQKDRVARGNVR